MSDRANEIRRRLTVAFAPLHLDVFDDSASHAGHSGAMASGGAYFYVTVVSPVFEGKSLIQRHQMVYNALGDMMREEIHALSMKVFTPSEYRAKGKPIHE